MRVVDEDGERLAGGDALHAAGDTREGGQRRREGERIAAERGGHRQGAEDVGDVVVAGQGRLEDRGATRMPDREDRAAGVEGEVRRADVGVGRETEGEHRAATAARLREDATGRVVDVDHADVRDGAVASVEEHRLDVEIRGEVAVVVDVIAGEVREGRDFEAETMDAFLVERVRAHFEAGARAARVGHLAEEGGEVGRIGRRLIRRDGTPAEVVADRADEPPLRTIVLEQVAEQRRDRGLAVGARHADETQSLFGTAVEAAGDLGEHPARIGDLGGGDGGQAGDGFARDDRGGAAGDHVVEEGVAVGPQARQGEEEGARDHAAAVRDDRGHAHRTVARPAEHGQPLEQRVEGRTFHRGGHHRGRRRHRPRSATGPRGRVETGGRSSQRMHFSATSRKTGAETLPP